MSTITQTLNAGVPVTFPGGEQFHLLEADEPVDVTFYESRNKPLEKWEGMKGGFRISFEKGFIQVRLVSATGQTVKIAGTSGRGEYDRLQGDVNATLTKSSVYWSSDDFVAVPGNSTVIPTNTNRRVLYLTSLPSNIHTLRLGGAAAAVNQGTPLEPGETMALETTAAPRCFNPGSINQSIAVSYTED